MFALCVVLGFVLHCVCVFVVGYFIGNVSGVFSDDVCL